MHKTINIIFHLNKKMCFWGHLQEVSIKGSPLFHLSCPSGSGKQHSAEMRWVRKVWAGSCISMEQEPAY